MDKITFAKLFDYPDGQLLVTLDPHDDTYDFTVVIFRVDGEDLSLAAKQDYKSEEKALREFNAFSEPAAREKFEGMQRMLTK